MVKRLDEEELVWERHKHTDNSEDIRNKKIVVKNIPKVLTDSRH